MSGSGNLFDRLNRSHRVGSATTLAFAILSIVLVVTFYITTFLYDHSSVSDAENTTNRPGENMPTGDSKLHPILVNRPTGPPRVDTGFMDLHGNPVTVDCSTCHATREPNFENKTPADLNEFHGALEVAHGTISCLSCHNENDYDSLKLADGSKVNYENVMELCAQCHGQQMREFEHGVHGGMTGFWDRSQGPQTKNNCVDCHNPHTPRFPKMQPSFKPHDRFLDKSGSH